MRIIVACIIIFIFNSCITNAIRDSNCIYTYSKFIIKDKTGKLLMNDSVGYQMLLFKDSVLCRIGTNVGTLINGEIKNSSKKYSYLYYQEKSNIGKYIAWNDSSNKVINVKVDSVFSFYSSTLKQNFYKPLQGNNVKLIDSIRSKNELIKKYSFYDSIQNAHGEWHLFFTERNKKFPFSLSKQLDSVTMMNLYKFRIIVFNSLEDKINNSTIEIGFENCSDAIKIDMINWKKKFDSLKNIQ